MAAYALYKPSSTCFDNREYLVTVTTVGKIISYVKHCNKSLVEKRTFGQHMLGGLKFRGYITEDAFHNIIFLDSI